MFQSFTKQIIKFSVEIERKTLLGIFILQIGHHQTTSIRSYCKFQSKENFDKYCGFVAISTIDTRLALNSFVRVSLKSTFIIISVQEILLQTRFHATRKLNFQTSYKPSILVAWLLAIRLFRVARSSLVHKTGSLVTSQHPNSSRYRLLLFPAVFGIALEL